MTPEAQSARPSTPLVERSPEERERLLAQLPAHTGCYLFRNDKNQVLYVGKANNLRTRVRSYFRERGDGRWTIRYLMRNVAGIDVLLTDTEKEALLLEHNLIQEHQPRYNVFLRDDKDYISIRLLARDAFPRFIVVRRPAKSSDPVFGPYSSAHNARATLNSLYRVFPVRNCSPAKFKAHRERACLDYQIGKCSGPCAGHISEEEHRTLVDGAVRLLRGDTEAVRASLEQGMRDAAAELRYEDAARYRDRIQALDITVEKQKVRHVGGLDRDVFGIAREGPRAAIVRLVIRNGRMIDGEPHHVTTGASTDSELMSSFLNQFYAGNRFIPAAIVIACDIEDAPALEDILSEKKGGRVSVHTPQRGEPRRLVDLAARNARTALDAKVQKDIAEEELLAELGRTLHLPGPPRRIEGVDMSTLMGTMAVGSVVAFTDGLPDKSRYRRYKIRADNVADDYSMMREVLMRRLTRGRHEDDLPDLLLLDGGKGQLGVAEAVCTDLGLTTVGLAALAKDRKKTGAGEKVFIPGRSNPVRISQHALHLLDRVRDEAHRFAIAYHRKLRTRAPFSTILTEIPGVGPTKVRRLLRHFGSLARLKEATPDEIADTPGVTRSDAKAIAAFLAGRAVTPEERARAEQAGRGPEARA